MITGQKVLFRNKEKCIFLQEDNTYSIKGYILQSENGYKIITFSLNEIEVLN